MRAAERALGVYSPHPGRRHRIDELYLEKSFYGSRRTTFDLTEEGCGVNRKEQAESEAF